MSNTFEALGLAPALLKAVEAAGFTDPTPVQAASIPAALQGHDLMVSAQTGSGKTAAFMLPALHRLCDLSPMRTPGARVLVLTPTRELAQQVNEATRAFGSALPWLRTATLVGGMPYGLQIKSLQRRLDVVVATPGRLIDHLQSGRLDLSEIQTLVLDEADRMLDMGFIEDIEAIVARLPKERQTLLFSATLDGTVAKLAAAMMRDPQRISLATAQVRHEQITQKLLWADDLSHKQRLLDHLLRDVSVGQAIVFSSTKKQTEELADVLVAAGFEADCLHGDMNQRQRNRTLALLQRGQVKILVATDVAARGIDVPGITHVINFDLPMQAEDYVHRIGRTGRAGRSGEAWTLASVQQRFLVKRIERFTQQTIPETTIAGLEPRVRPMTPRGAGRGSNGAPRGDFKSGAPRRDFKPGGSRTSDHRGRREGFSERREGFAGPREGHAFSREPHVAHPGAQRAARPASGGFADRREGHGERRDSFANRTEGYSERREATTGARVDSRPAFSPDRYSRTPRRPAR